MVLNEFGKWLERKYIAWLAADGQRRTITEFAEWLEIPRPLVSYYMKGTRKPSRKNTDLIAAHLGPEVYDLLGLQRPDPLLQDLQSHWDNLTDEQRHQISQILTLAKSSKRGTSLR